MFDHKPREFLSVYIYIYIETGFTAIYYNNVGDRRRVPYDIYNLPDGRSYSLIREWWPFFRKKNKLKVVRAKRTRDGQKRLVFVDSIVFYLCTKSGGYDVKYRIYCSTERSRLVARDRFGPPSHTVNGDGIAVTGCP